MFKKEIEYAIRGLVYIQQQNTKGLRPGIVEIAEQAAIPKSFLAKIMQRIVKMGMLKSIKGKNGGFYFITDKPDLTLTEVMIALDSNPIQECGFGLSKCDCNNPCPFHDRYKDIRSLTELLISSESIQSLAGK